MRIIFVSLLCVISCFAHPHYFLDSDVKISDNIIKNSWKFDMLNSRILMFDFDKNKNKILDEDEKKEFLEINFYKLKQNNFNIFLSNDEDEFEIEPKNVVLKYENKRLAIVFDIIYKKGDNLTFCTMDEKLYLAYKLNSLKTKFNTQIQKSEYDFCIGVSK